jgi:hypothetical protein
MSKEWQDSELVRDLRSVPEQAKIYATLPSSIRFLTGREVRQLPNTVNPRTQQPNSNYEAEMALMQSESERPGIALVYSKGDLQSWYPSEQAVKQTMELSLVTKDPKGSLYLSSILLPQKSASLASGSGAN